MSDATITGIIAFITSLVVAVVGGLFTLKKANTEAEAEFPFKRFDNLLEEIEALQKGMAELRADNRVLREEQRKEKERYLKIEQLYLESQRKIISLEREIEEIKLENEQLTLENNKLRERIRSLEKHNGGV